MRGFVLLCAGGTGGHLFPAQALAVTLALRGGRIALATDERVEAYGGDFPAEETFIIPSATITRQPVAAAKALVTLGRGYLAARKVIRTIKPAAVVGFGGYPTLPPVLAATRMRVPTVIHDANAVLGRANRFLAKRVTAIATSQATVGGAEPFMSRVVETGNPVRPAVIEASKVSYPLRYADGRFRLLVFGGSQGARFLSDLVPAAVAKMSAAHRGLIRIVQQCRPEDLERTSAAYKAIGVTAVLEPFFRDLPDRIAASHLVVCRSGASTVAELTTIGRAAIMMPLPHALDQDQKANALVLARAGGGWMVEQKEMTPERLAGDLADLIDHPDRLAAAAAAARLIGRPDAVDRLADLVERVAAGETPTS